MFDVWMDSFWFPSNVTWRDLESEPADGRYYPRAIDLLISVPIAFILIGVRYVVERYVFPNFITLLIYSMYSTVPNIKFMVEICPILILIKFYRTIT